MHLISITVLCVQAVMILSPLLFMPSHSNSYITCMPLRMYWQRLFFVVFQEMQCLHNFNHDDVRHVTELYLSNVCQCCG